MTDRERFVKVTEFQPVDHPIYWEVEGFISSDYGTETGSTIDRWKKEGLYLPFGIDIRDYFGFDHFEEGVDLCFVGGRPLFEEITIEETDEYRIWRREDGVTLKRLKKTMAMPQWLDFPIKDRKTWKEYKRRIEDSRRGIHLDSEKWESYKERLKRRDHPLAIHPGSLYGGLRDLIGVERFSFMFHDEPLLVSEMMEYFNENRMGDIQKALNEIDIDYACFGEDIAYKNGPLISPKMFREFMLPIYKKMTFLLKKHGINYIFVDSDGNIEELIPLWLEGGVNGFYPLEVNAGMDPVKLRKKYGKDIILLGGIDKMPLIKGDKRAIKEEVMKKLPFLFSKGGYIGGLDHGVPPDISFDSYRLFIELVREIMYG